VIAVWTPKDSPRTLVGANLVTIAVPRTAITAQLAPKRAKNTGGPEVERERAEAAEPADNDEQQPPTGKRAGLEPPDVEPGGQPTGRLV
jgi:hypothetical protein